MRTKIHALSSVLMAAWLAVMTGCEQSPPTQQQSQQGAPPPANQSVAPVSGAPAQPAAPVAKPNAAKPQAPPAAPVAGLPIPLGDVKNGQASTARNFYFILDGSSSMREEPARTPKGGKKFGSKIEGAIWATEELLPKIPPQDNIGLWVFDAGGQREVVPLGINNRTAFLNAVKKVDVNNGLGTPLGEAIKAGVDKLVAQYQKQLGYGEYRLIVVTDGEANGHVKIPDAAAYAQKYALPIYTIGVSMTKDPTIQKYSVSYRDAQSIEDLKRGLEDALAEVDLPDKAP